MKSFITKLNKYPTLKKWCWFIALYVLGIVVVGGFIYAMRIILGLPH